MIKDPIVLLLTRLNTLIANKYEKTQNRDETKAFGARGKLQLTQFLRNLMALPAVRSVSSARRRVNPRSTFCACSVAHVNYSITPTFTWTNVSPGVLLTVSLVENMKIEHVRQSFSLAWRLFYPLS